MKQGRTATGNSKHSLASVSTLWWKVILVVVSFVFYGNSLSNETALDDVMVLSQNKFVQAGVSGIPDIFTHDSFYGAAGKPSSRMAWRYRPLSLAAFAIEHTLFGNTWSGYHFMNVFWYTVLCLLIFTFFYRHVFPENVLAAFSVALLFAIHPVHTEVVDNIKSRDELFAAFFMLGALHYLFLWLKSNKRWQQVVSLMLFVLALFSKESSLVWAVTIPVCLFVSGQSVKDSILKAIPFGALSVCFVLIRLSVSSAPEATATLANNSYLHVSESVRIASIFDVLLRYLGLMLWPTVLRIDYNYRVLPFASFSEVHVLLSMAIYLALAVFTCLRILQRRWSGVFLLTYLLILVSLSNLFTPVGTPLAERFLFVPGLFLIGALIDELLRIPVPAFKQQRLVVVSLLIGLSSLACMKVVGRNTDWKNNRTLYFADIVKCEESFRMQAFCGMTLMSEADQLQDSLQQISVIRQALPYFYRAYAINPDYEAMYQDWGRAYVALGNLDSAEWAWNRLAQLKPDSKYIAGNKEFLSLKMFDALQLKYYNEKTTKDPEYLLRLQQKAISYYDKVPAAWNVLGKLYFITGRPDSAQWAFLEALKRDSANNDAKALLYQLSIERSKQTTKN